MNNSNEKGQAKWQYAGQERDQCGNGWCQFCGRRYLDEKRLEPLPDCHPWRLYAPDAWGMPGEEIVRGEWCCRECFEADLHEQVTNGAAPKYEDRQRTA